MAWMSQPVSRLDRDRAADHAARLREIAGLAARIARDLLLLAAVLAGLGWALSGSLG